VGGVVAAARTAARPAPHSPLNVDIGAQRRYGVARTALEDYRTVRAARGGTVNDVVLATVAGALRSWLLFRGEAVNPGTSVRAMVPVSVRDDAGRAGPFGNGRVSSYVVDLPVGEPNPLVRLSQVTYAMRAHSESGQSIGADSIVALGGFAPPTLHAMGARAAYGLTRRLFNLVVTNVPGPQFPLYAAGARLDELFPIVPLARGQAIAVGLTSYDGGVYYGLNADRDAMPDVDVLGSLIEESLAELVLAAREAGPRPGVPTAGDATTVTPRPTPVRSAAARSTPRSTARKSAPRTRAGHGGDRAPDAAAPL
ncbi:WS/DGAT domain-containing protein, partial [Jatrophihabitans sp. YIM 134969]